MTMHGRVVTTEWSTPSLVRLVLGGEGLDGFEAVPYADAYVNVAIPPAGASYTAPFYLAEVQQRLPREQWPARRRYTVRRWEPGRRHLTLEFVVHGDEGVAGPWAAAAVEGDALVLTGPSGAYTPDPEADWHLLVGDESALPAIAAALETVPSRVPVVARLLVDGPDHELPLSTPGDLDLEWRHRSGRTDAADLLAAAVRELTFPSGGVHAFVHGEAGEVREVRRHLLADRGVPRADLSASPYWRRHLTDEAWRQVKSDWNAEVERDV